MSNTTPKTVHPLWALAGIVFHGAMLFVVPFVVGGIAGMFLEISQVAETSASLTLFAFVCIAPIFVMQVVGVVAKTWRETRFARKRGALTLRGVLDAAYRNARILTSRGYAVLGTGVVFVLLALAFQWASLGVVAVASLTLFYVVTGAAVFVSAFLVRTFEAGMGRNRAGIRRLYQPSVGQSGDAVEEHVVLEQVPILPGFYLVLQDQLPDRLNTEVRHVVPPQAKRRTTTLKTALRETPRGTYQTGPASIWYMDMLGLTQVNVASMATGEVKILPRVQPVEIIEPPRTPLQEPDILTRPHKFPTEDFFRFREYLPGDDTRRLHWKLSMRVGQLQVRLPESREHNARKVLLALDTYVPPGWASHTVVIDDLLDALVDVWVSTASQLLAQGEHVTLVAGLPDLEGNITRQTLACERVDRAQWLDAGARARWQSDMDVNDLYEADNEAQYMVVLTSRLAPPPADPYASQRETTWVYLHPKDTIGPEPPSLFRLWLDWRDTGEMSDWEAARRFLQLPHAVGSEENALSHRVKHFLHRRSLREHRLYVRRQVTAAGEQAFGALLARPDVVYRMQVLQRGYRLTGISSGAGGPQRPLPDAEPAAPPHPNAAPSDTSTLYPPPRGV